MAKVLSGEADTGEKLIASEFRNSSWTEDRIKREVHISEGKKIDESRRCQQPKFEDCVLYNTPTLQLP
jgi:hypothetical protein